MDRESDQRPGREEREGDGARSREPAPRDTPQVEAPASDTRQVTRQREPDEPPHVVFSLWLSRSGVAQDFEDPRAAGAAFFHADPSERPSVAEIAKNAARTMARTEIHGAHETGEPRYFKSLPDSHLPDAAFRAGFLAAMETSIAERLEKVEFAKEGAKAVERLDPGLKDDLEAFARREPEKAAALWAARTEEPAPGPVLQAAVQAREGELGREGQMDEPAPGAAERGAPAPVVVATGDWVITDRDVDLRPVAVETERGIHSGYEARMPGGEREIIHSERTFPEQQEALGQAWEFYERGEPGLDRAIAGALPRDRDDEEARVPQGFVIEHREQPEFPRPETAIYAEDEAQLVMTLGRETEVTHTRAEALMADPAFRQVVAEHIPDAESTIGPGRFIDGQGSAGFLPDELLAVTAYGRDGSAEVVARFPDEGPLSQALARHLTTSPVLAAHLATEADPAPSREALAADPAQAIPTWSAVTGAAIDRLPAEAREDLRKEARDIAREAATAFGLDRSEVGAEAQPRSTIYATSLKANTLTLGAEGVALSPDAASTLKTALQVAASETGIQGATIERRLATGASHAREEEDWVRSDIREVARHHQLDLGGDAGRNRAAELVDRFYERAAGLVLAAHAAEVTRMADPLLDVLGTLASAHAAQGGVRFRTEDQAQGFAEEMKERYGASILKDMAAGRTEALDRDIPDPTARQAIAAAVVAAAREHPSIGLELREAEAGARSVAADASRPERSRDLARDLGHDREF